MIVQWHDTRYPGFVDIDMDRQNLTMFGMF
jgi:hypothetical protein